MKMNSKVVMISGLAFTMVLFLVVLHYNRPPVGEVVAAIIYDRSLSPRDGCDSVKRLTERGMSLAEEQRAKFTLKVFATGDESTAYEPVAIELPPLPKKTGRVLEGKNHFAGQKSEFVENTYVRCSELNRTEKSPIFLTVKRAVEYLKVVNSKVTPERYLLVQTDLEENVEPDIKKAIRASLGTMSKLPPQIDNAGIKIMFCGYSGTTSQVTVSTGRTQPATPPRNAKSADRLLEVWRGLFTHPELVTFNPVCSDK